METGRPKEFLPQTTPIILQTPRSKEVPSLYAFDQSEVVVENKWGFVVENPSEESPPSKPYSPIKFHSIVFPTCVTECEH